jgi:hypothetical protein
MEFLGRFLGVTQDPSTLALRPKLGWAVRRGSAMDLSLARLSGHDPAPPLDSPEFDRCIDKFSSENRCELPGDFPPLLQEMRRGPPARRGRGCRLSVPRSQVGRDRRGLEDGATRRPPGLLRLGPGSVGPILRPRRRDLPRPGVESHLQEGVEGRKVRDGQCREPGSSPGRSMSYCVEPWTAMGGTVRPSARSPS